MKCILKYSVRLNSLCRSYIFQYLSNRRLKRLDEEIAEYNKWYMERTAI
jgi:hypothetical protein